MTEHQGGCLFTEADWEVWEEINARQAKRELRYISLFSPCCNVAIRRLRADYIENGKHKVTSSNCYICSKCEKIFRISLKIEVMK